MNDKSWSPGTFLPDTISGKELVKTFFKFSMTRAEWIASVAVVSRGSPQVVGPRAAVPSRQPLRPRHAAPSFRICHTTSPRQP